MNFKAEELFHPRIAKHCEKLFDDDHYSSATLEAMKQVELALKEKSGEKKKYGVTLITHLFGEGKSVKLRMPFGEEMQAQTESYFKSVFAFYRNYAAHDGSKINRTVCLRTLVVASELLDLIGTSRVSFTDVGGVSNLIKSELFTSKNDVRRLLEFLSNYSPFPIVVADGYFEDLATEGYDEKNVGALIDVGLVEFTTGDCQIPDDLADFTGASVETVGWFELTKQGKKVLDELSTGA